MKKQFPRTIVVRITESQYTRLKNRIIEEKQKGIKSKLTKIDRSEIIRELINKYGTISRRSIVHNR